MRNKRNKRTATNKRNNIKKKKIVIVLTAFGMLIIFSIIFALLNSLTTKMVNKLTIELVNVSGLELGEAYQKVNEEIEKRISNNLVIKYLDYETTLSLKQLEVSINTQELVDEAYKVGRNSNIISSNYEIIFTQLFGKNIKKNITFNEEELNKIIDDISVKIPGIMQESSYYIEEDRLIILAGKEGIQVQKDKLKEDIIKQIENQIHNNKQNEIQIAVSNASPNEIDIESIYKEIFKEAQNAYLEIETGKINPEQDGIDFAISRQEAIEMLEDKKEEYIIPLKITKPQTTLADLGDKVFSDELGKYNTRYSITNENRNTNIELASQKIDGYILKPGETFSYNKVVGERTIKAGYKEAAVYVNGEVVDGIGGGICQVSSTLYNAVIYANLEIVSRKNHYFLTSYVGASRDATVSYGTIDFKFKNNRNYPIKIECKAKNGISEVRILGRKEETEYEVVIQNEITQILPYTTKIINTDKLQSGVQRIVRKGTNGYKSEAYKVLKLNGKIISKELLSKDSYNPMQEIIEVGR